MMTNRLHRSLCLLLLLLVVASGYGVENVSKIELVILDPGHFHASLLQKSMMPQVSDTVRVYAPKGVGLDQYLKDIDSYNHRSDQPTHWHEIVYTGDDYLQKMVSDHHGNVVVLAGNNQKKTLYLLQAVKAGYNVLSDKPMAINKQDLQMLREAYALASKKGLFLYDLMTERYDILNIIEKNLIHNVGLFGVLKKGTLAHPSVTMESVHHFCKMVSGRPVTRPAWYYDTAQQGEGIADVTTHLIDLIHWQCFPDKKIGLKDVKVLNASHWPTRIGLHEFSLSTGVSTFPNYLKKDVQDSTLRVMSNGTFNYQVKGVNVGIKVVWNFTPPVGGNDTFSSVKEGTKAKITIVQNKGNKYVRQLYVQRNKGVAAMVFQKQLQKAIQSLQLVYPFVSVQDKGGGLYLIDVPAQHLLSHEAQFCKVAECFFGYIRQKYIPQWENENTLSKYAITTSAVEMAKKK